ncbi:hypothetical protein [Arthrobacter sp.]|uniref:hypothetical protein n=1 Tax=Arthrobacter sp. TaxID=1667 RepID=UPI0033991D59
MGDQADVEAGSVAAGIEHSGSTPTTSADTSLAAWHAILDLLEGAVGAAERTLKDPLGPLSAALESAVVPLPEGHWQPSVLPGPLPEEARRRAVALSAAQTRIASRLEEARLDVAKQLQAVSSVPGVGDPSGAVYLDVNG